ncbi:hypothetical protein ABZS94_26080 [Streptomyces sp. NPDC005500]|uniref:hypothetical protein n=1 Tax=Streptomyces sp. NPDC005500 TaxID=3155007 RepID=UPI0033A42E62
MRADQFPDMLGNPHEIEMLRQLGRARHRRTWVGAARNKGASFRFVVLVCAHKGFAQVAQLSMVGVFPKWIGVPKRIIDAPEDCIQLASAAAVQAGLEDSASVEDLLPHRVCEEADIWILGPSPELARADAVCFECVVDADERVPRVTERNT